MKSWQHGPQDLTKLEQLGLATARLMRLLVFQKISRGESQLRANGLSTNLTDLYKEHMQTELPPLVPEKPPVFVKFTATKESEF